MNKTIQRCAIIVAIGVYIILSICAPWVFGDKNEMARNFVERDMLNLLGVILALTLASASNLHLEFNKIEDVAKREMLTRSRRSLKRAVVLLITLFLAAVFLVVTKSLLVEGDISSSLFNGLAILIVFFNVLVLIDLTQVIFKIPPTYKIPVDDKKC